MPFSWTGSRCPRPPPPLLIGRLIWRPGQRMGAVGDLRRVAEAARVAWAVMNHTRHSFLVGESGRGLLLPSGFELRAQILQDQIV